MKRIIPSMMILILSLALILSMPLVSAETENNTIKTGDLLQIKDGVTFNSDDLSIRDIELPNTYWVEVIGENDHDSHYLNVRYNGITLSLQKIIANNLKRYDYSKSTVTYYEPTTALKVELDVDKFETPLMSKKDWDRGDEPIARLTNDTHLTLLNVAYNSKISRDVYLVATAENKVGYVLAKDTNIKETFTIPNWVEPAKDPILPDINKPVKPPVNPDIVPGTDDSKEDVKVDKDGDKKTTQGNVVKIVLIVSICILAAVLVFLIFKPTRKKNGRYSIESQDDYDRDEEYDDNY